jgi:hypothetical protein
MRFRAWAMIGLLVGGLGWLARAAGPLAQPLPVDPDANAAALTALGASLDVERDILLGQQETYRLAAADRDAASRKLTTLLAEFDAIVQGSGPVSAETTGAKEKEIADAESRRAAANARCREILGRILAAQERVSGLEKKLVALRGGQARPTKDTVSGNWRVLYLPGNNRGVFAIRQSGTILQGVYQLDGGWKGSLQGTFIDGKVYLQRIDSKLGRSSELDGYLSSDGGSIRGTWRNYNLTDGGSSAGSWTASRQEDQ